MKHWDPRKKPSADECPEEFCFHWAPAGSYVALGVYPSAREALRHMVPVGEGTCACLFGRCRRRHPQSDLRDWYEFHGPMLEMHGLPWFYFIPEPHKVVEELREEYIRESRKLWGADGAEDPVEGCR